MAQHHSDHEVLPQDADPPRNGVSVADHYLLLSEGEHGFEGESQLADEVVLDVGCENAGVDFYVVLVDDGH